MRCSKFCIKFIFENKEKKAVLYTLSRATSNGGIDFVLALKFEKYSIFCRPPPKTLYFLCNSFSLRLTENLHKQKYFLEMWYSCFV